MEGRTREERFWTHLPVKKPLKGNQAFMQDNPKKVKEEGGLGNLAG